MHENQTVDFVKEKVNFVIGASILIFSVAIIVVFCNASQNSNKKKISFYSVMPWRNENMTIILIFD